MCVCITSPKVPRCHFQDGKRYLSISVLFLFFFFPLRPGRQGKQGVQKGKMCSKSISIFQIYFSILYPISIPNLFFFHIKKSLVQESLHLNLISQSRISNFKHTQHNPKTNLKHPQKDSLYRQDPGPRTDSRPAIARVCVVRRARHGMLFSADIVCLLRLGVAIRVDGWMDCHGMV